MEHSVVRQEAISREARDQGTSIDRTTSRAGCREISCRRVCPCFTRRQDGEQERAVAREWTKIYARHANTLALTRKQKVAGARVAIFRFILISPVIKRNHFRLRHASLIADALNRIFQSLINPSYIICIASNFYQVWKRVRK